MEKNIFDDEQFKDLLENLTQASDELPEAAAILDAIRRLGDDGEDEDFDSILSEINGILGDMEKKYGSVTVRDDDGNEHSLEILGTVCEDKDEYLIVSDTQNIENPDDGTDVFVLHLIDEDDDGTGTLEFVTDDETCDRLLDKFYENYGDDENE